MFLKKKNKIKGITWFIFSGFATFCAFFLPAYIIILWIQKPLPNLFFYSFTIIIIITSIYHSYYRIEASKKDLSLVKYFFISLIITTIIIFITFYG